MEDQIIKYIKEQLSLNQSISQIYNALQRQGYTKEQIDKWFQTALRTQNQQESIQPAATLTAQSTQGLSPTTQTTTQQPTAIRKRFDLTKAFVLIGAILIVLAVIIVIYSQWYSVGPLGKIMFLLLPMSLLYILSAALSNKERYGEVGDITLGLASFILPFGTRGTVPKNTLWPIIW